MKKSILLLLMIILGCKLKSSSTSIQISLTNDNRSLNITGIDNDITHEIDRDSIATAWQSLIPVYRMPADTEMKDLQTPQPGKYQVENNAVVFTPDTPFAKHQSYFVRYYQYTTANSAFNFIIQHKKLGKTPYIDLIFKQ